MAASLNLEELKAKAESLVKSITADKDLMASFTKDPIGTLEKKLGIDLPDEQINQVIEGVKGKIDLKQFGLDDVTKATGLLGKLKGIFGK